MTTQSFQLSINPWRTIWRQPRHTMRQIIEFDPTHKVMVLAALQGIFLILLQAMEGNWGKFFLQRDGVFSSGDLGALMGFIAIIGSGVGVLTLYLYSWFLGLTGRWLGGQGSNQEIRTALAWTNVPLVFVLALFIVQIFLLGGEAFFTDSQVARGSTTPFVSTYL